MDMSILVGTFAGIKETMSKESFHQAASLLKSSKPALYPWVQIAAIQWPEPLFRLEYIASISILDIYAQGLLFALLMAEDDVPVTVYTNDWSKYKKRFKAKIRNNSTQNIRSIVAALKNYFHLNIVIDNALMEQIEIGNRLRNDAVHSMSYLNIADPETAWVWMKENTPQRKNFRSDAPSELPYNIIKAIRIIDHDVMAVNKLPLELTMYSSEDISVDTGEPCQKAVAAEDAVPEQG